MRVTRPRAVYLVLTSLLFATQAGAHDLRPGLYEIEVAVSAAGAVSETTLTQCMSVAAIEGHDPFDVFTAFARTNCLKLPMCFGNGKAGFDIVCVDGRPEKVSARFRMSRERFTGTIRLTRQDAGRLVSVVETQQGRRIGACDDTSE